MKPPNESDGPREGTAAIEGRRCKRLINTRVVNFLRLLWLQSCIRLAGLAHEADEVVTARLARLADALTGGRR